MRQRAKTYQRPELVCPAGTPAALRAAVDAGADAVYCGLQNETNARNFPGLNFTPAEVEQSLAYAHARKAKLLLAVNTFPPAGKFAMWRDADRRRRQARRRRGDRRRHGRGRLRRATPIRTCGCICRCRPAPPRRRRSASIASNSASSAWCCRACSPSPRSPSCTAQIPCEIEAFIFGNIGMMAEGRCSLSNYVTGLSTNMDGVCSPAADVHYEEDAARNLTTRLGEFVIDCFAGGESAGYPTICKGRYTVQRQERSLLRLRGAGQPQSVGAAARPDARRASPRSRSRAASAAAPT